MSRAGSCRRKIKNTDNTPTAGEQRKEIMKDVSIFLNKYHHIKSLKESGDKNLQSEKQLEQKCRDFSKILWKYTVKSMTEGLSQFSEENNPLNSMVAHFFHENMAELISSSDNDNLSKQLYRRLKKSLDLQEDIS